MSDLRPTSARLQRYTIDLHQLSHEYDIWLLDLPYQAAFNHYTTAVKELVKDKTKGEYLGIPYRLLNNALMTLCPTLTHGFEKIQGKKRYAMAVGVPGLPAQVPDPQHLRRIVRFWTHHWAAQSYIKDNLRPQDWNSLLDELETAISDTTQNWQWERVDPISLLTETTSNPLSYHAVPSLLASLLHNKRSMIYDTEISWRKAQDTDGRLSIVSQPLWASYTDTSRGDPVNKDGWFAYKLVFELETQAGSDNPWLFVSLHAQRYGDAKLQRANTGRNVSVLVGTNRSRLDEFPFDSTLTRLSFDFEKKVWQDDLPALLNRIGVLEERQLLSPNVLVNAEDPRDYWKTEVLTTSSEVFENEYYIVHAEGYGYGSHGAGHDVRPGYSQTERSTVLSAVLEHLPMLQPDRYLIPDALPIPSGRQKPRAMRDIGELKTLKTTKPGDMSDVVARALRHETLFIAVLYNDPLTRDGVVTALRETFFLRDEQAFPPNVRVQDFFVTDALHKRIESGPGKRSYLEQHRDKVREWSEYLQDMLPLTQTGTKVFAIIERLRDKEHGWGLYGVIRDACARNSISSQMIGAFSYQNDKQETRVKRDADHRANTAAREISLRHLGAFYGHPKEAYGAAGIDHPLEVLAFHVEIDQSGVQYPVAVKIRSDGSVAACFPRTESTGSSWELYPQAATILGELVSDQWKFSQWDQATKSRKLGERGGARSILAMERTALTRFVMNVLLNLDKPTVVVFAGKNWRDYDIWPQLRNADLSTQRQVLNFNNVPGTRVEEIIDRDDPRITNLIGVVRVRTGDETPQYLTDTLWEFRQSAGFIDFPREDLLHYFSIGKELKTAKRQSESSARYAPMTGGGAGIAYRMPQIVEFVPFFVRQDYDTDEGKTRICRVLHYLRVSPAWEMGNIIYPYPLHLAMQMVRDQLVILGNHED